MQELDDAWSASRTAARTQGRTTPVAITPVAYDLCASGGVQKFATPHLPRGTDIRNLPVAKAPAVEEKPSRFATRMIIRTSDPTGATDRNTAPGGTPSVDVVSSYRNTRTIDDPADLPSKPDNLLTPPTHHRHDPPTAKGGPES